MSHPFTLTLSCQERPGIVSHDPRALATVGQDAEALALSRVVRWHSE